MQNPKPRTRAPPFSKAAGIRLKCAVFLRQWRPLYANKRLSCGNLKLAHTYSLRSLYKLHKYLEREILDPCINQERDSGSLHYWLRYFRIHHAILINIWYFHRFRNYLIFLVYFFALWYLSSLFSKTGQKPNFDMLEFELKQFMLESKCTI